MTRPIHLQCDIDASSSGQLENRLGPSAFAVLHGLVCSQRERNLTLGFRPGPRDHGAGAEHHGDLDGVAAHPAGSGRNEHRLSPGDLRDVVEHDRSGQTRHDDPGRGVAVQAVRNGDQALGVGQCVLGISARGIRSNGAEDRCPDPQILNPVAESGDSTCDLGSGYERHRCRNRVDVAAAAHQIGEVDRCRVDLDQHLARAGLRVRQLDELQHLGAALLGHLNRLHRHSIRCGTSESARSIYLFRTANRGLGHLIPSPAIQVPRSVTTRAACPHVPTHLGRPGLLSSGWLPVLQHVPASRHHRRHQVARSVMP